MRVPIHEIGHAAAMAHFGWAIREVSIVPDDRYDGLVTHDGPTPGAAPLEAYIVAICGYEAERNLAGGQDVDPRGSVEDFEDAHRELEAAVPDDKERLVLKQRGDNYARHIIATNWPLIEALAAHLQKHRRLSGAQVLDFIRAHNEREGR